MNELPQQGLDFLAGGVRHEGFSLAKIQVAPLVDTVLFLIWFYLLVGQLVIHQKDAAVQLPAMASPMSTVEVPAELVINVRQDSTITIDGRPTETAALGRLVASELAKAQAAGQQLRVVVRADRRQRFALLDEVLRTCRRAGLSQVVFRAVAEGAL